MLCKRSMKSVATGRGQNSKRPRSGHIETSPEYTNHGRLEYEGYQRVDRGYMYASTKYEVSRWSVASCKNRGSFTSKFVLNPNPSLMAKCIQTTNEIPTAWAAFRDGAEKLPMCPSAQNDSSFHSEIVICVWAHSSRACRRVVEFSDSPMILYKWVLLRCTCTVLWQYSRIIWAFLEGYTCM